MDNTLLESDYLQTIDEYKKKIKMKESMLQAIKELAIDAMGEWFGVEIPYFPENLMPFYYIIEMAERGLEYNGTIDK